MRRIGVAAEITSSHSPIASNMRCVLRDRAVERSSKLGCRDSPRATASTTATRNPSGSRASARLAPIMPPPAITMSYCVSVESLISALHQRLDGIGLFRETLAEYVSAIRRDHNVIFDADAYVTETRRDLAAVGQVDAGFDRHRH